jgi:hypothetical protein
MAEEKSKTSFKIMGNNKASSIGIVAFIVILVILSVRCAHASGAELDFRTGYAFGNNQDSPVIGLDLYVPLKDDLNVFAGTMMWGASNKTANNWSWESGLRTCRWNVCASLGASYLQRIDAISGSHTNYYLGLTYLLPFERFHSVGFAHISNAGTTQVNKGRNAVMVDWKLQ